MPWPQIDTVVIHYTAADDLIDGDVGEDWAGIPAYLRAIQSSYLNRQPTGYSVGYNWAVDQRGEVWELRGSDVKCAANRDHNDHCVAVLVLVDGDDQATPPAAAASFAVSSFIIIPPLPPAPPSSLPSSVPAAAAWPPHWSSLTHDADDGSLPDLTRSAASLADSSYRNRIAVNASRRRAGTAGSGTGSGWGTSMSGGIGSGM